MLGVRIGWLRKAKLAVVLFSNFKLALILEVLVLLILLRIRIRFCSWHLCFCGFVVMAGLIVLGDYVIESNLIIRCQVPKGSNGAVPVDWQQGRDLGYGIDHRI